MPGNVNSIDDDERIVEIEIERLRPFRSHPFKVKDDQEMKDLIDSISRYGILTPLVVRPLPEGVYEIISGHRRKHAAEQLGFRKLPVIIRVLTDEDAVVSMVDSNMHREKVLPSEKAFAYKMKYEAMKQKSGRRKGSRPGHSIKGKKTVQIMGEEAGESPKQLQRYLKIAELIPELMQMLDKGEISFNPAYESAFLKVARVVLLHNHTSGTRIHFAKKNMDTIFLAQGNMSALCYGHGNMSRTGIYKTIHSPSAGTLIAERPFASAKLYIFIYSFKDTFAFFDHLKICRSGTIILCLHTPYNSKFHLNLPPVIGSFHCRVLKCLKIICFKSVRKR